jgi:hypothetical protein
VGRRQRGSRRDERGDTTRIIRDVRPGDSFTRQISSALASSQGALSRRHFDAYIYPEILRRFAIGWDQMPQLPGHPDHRLLIEPMYPVHTVAVQGRELSDGVIELIGITVDWMGLEDPDG